MPSSKGKPTDPKLREEVKEEVKNETNKDGGGKGQWSAWKASKLSKEYEKRGGDYENKAGTKNEPKKGAPQLKSGGKKQDEEEEEEEEKEEDKEEEEEDKKPKANTAKKAKLAKKTAGQLNREDAKEKEKTRSNTQVEKNLVKGTRKSERNAGKRKDYGEEGGVKEKKKEAKK
ncbi:hypothetical protein PMIN06_010460 [Paraphaeosphaeria minitans]|uniref:Uncharacterized protein n=1 Tax=Paraphaeosphaeria minitans TaxID=565426 RepID=A0A9P6GMJ4_9PLEO|nr:hypothetical protein PMIN01_03269 [Paraphaeosphaeria minitans]